MTMTDPIADMLTRLRNANQAFHDQATMPSSKIKVKIAEILKQEGYISEYSVHEPTEDEVGKTLTVTLKYGRDRERSQGSAGSRSRAFACTRSRTSCRKYWAGWASRSSRRARACLSLIHISEPT